jgi:two-component sensor histidine kinase
MTPQLHNLLRATLSGGADIDAYEHLLRRPGEAERAVVLNIKRLEGEEGARLVVTLSDVTEARMAARLKDEMIREKGILLDEVQHRVANSLQIIASVLLQNARKVSSEESRAHLRDAHDRVMSMATVQRQLSTAKLGEVDLKPYFHELCDSLAASMISDHAQQSIVVTVDDSRVKANVSISLGLIVTELLINAIKHAFPVGAPGRIEVDYHSRGPNWALTVADNGQGFPTNPSEVKPGLGTSIIEALARQLEAKVRIPDHRGHGFRGKVGTISTRRWAWIPRQGGRPV